MGLAQGFKDRFNAVALTLRVDRADFLDETERQLRGHDATLGWWPATSTLETFGELLETRAGGLKSALYGDLASNCIAIEAELPGGERVTSRVVPRSAAGPDWKHLLLGGRGETGRILGATLRVFPTPAMVSPVTYEFLNLTGSVRALSALIHSGALPAVANIVVAGQDRCHLHLTFEGEPALCLARFLIAERVCLALDGKGLGEQPALEWLARIQQNPGGRLIDDSILVAPTLAVEAGWSRLGPIAETVRTKVGDGVCITRAGHASGTLLIDARDCPGSDTARLVAQLDKQGGISYLVGSSAFRPGGLVADIALAAREAISDVSP